MGMNARLKCTVVASYSEERKSSCLQIGQFVIHFLQEKPPPPKFHTDSQQCQWSNHLIRVLEGNDMEGGKHKGLGRGVSMA